MGSHLGGDNRRTSQMSRKNIRIVPDGNGLAVKLEGVESLVSCHRTRSPAENAGRPIARTGQGELVTHRPNGQIRVSLSA